MLLRIIKAYIAYHLRRNSKWLPKIVNHETPKHICEFITQKCGSKEKGFEGRKVRYTEDNTGSHLSICIYITYNFLLVFDSYLDAGGTHILVPICSTSRKCY
jgi:hypothetical protein